MEMKSTLRVVDGSVIEAVPGIVHGQTIQPLVGIDAAPSERLRIAVARFEPGVHEHLHWHPIEVSYYALAGSAIVRDYAGKEYPVKQGFSIYAPAGIAGSHEWQVGAEGLQLLSIRATRAGHRRMQFTVDRETRRSYIELEDLVKMDALDFESHYGKD